MSAKKIYGAFLALLGVTGFMRSQMAGAAVAGGEQYGPPMPGGAQATPSPVAPSWPDRLSRRQAIAICDKIDAMYGRALSSKYGRFFVPALLYVESAGNVNASRYEPHLKTSSVGLMQILPTTAQEVRRIYNAMPFDLSNPESNVYYGYGYLMMLSTWRGRPRTQEWVIRAYNGGPGWEVASQDSLNMTANHWAKVKREITAMKGVI